MEGREAETPESHATRAAKRGQEEQKKSSDSSSSDSSVSSRSKKKSSAGPVEEAGQLVFECPLYDIVCSRERLFAGGGGGATRSGVPNQWAVLHWMPTSDQLKLVALSSNGSSPARSGSVCPSDVSLVAVSAGSLCQLYQLDDPRVSRGGAADARLLRSFTAAPNAPTKKAADDDAELRVLRWHWQRPLLAAGSSDGWLRVFDAAGKLRAANLMQTDAAVMDAAWRPNLLAAVSPKTCMVWKVLPSKTKEQDASTAAAAADSAKHKEGDEEETDSADANPNANANANDDKLLAPIVSFGSHHQARHADATFRGCAWAGPDSSPFLVVGSVSRAARNSWLCCYGGAEFERLVSCEALPYALTAVCSSQDGRLVGCGSAEGHVAVYSVVGGALSWVMTTNPHTFFVSGVCFSPDASHVLSCSGDRALHKQLVVQQPRRRFSKVMAIFFTFLVLLFAIIYARVGMK